MELRKGEIEFIEEYRSKCKPGLRRSVMKLYLAIMENVDTSVSSAVEIPASNSVSGRPEEIDLPIEKLLDDFTAIYQDGYDMKWPSEEVRKMAKDFLELHGLI